MESGKNLFNKGKKAILTTIAVGTFFAASGKDNKDVKMDTKNPGQTEAVISAEEIQKMQHNLDSIENVRDDLLEKQDDLQKQFAAKAFKFNSIVTSVLEHHDKDTQKKFEDLINLPALIQKYYAFINENRNNPNVNVEKAKATLVAMQGQMKDMTALMAQFGNLQFGTVHNINSDDIQLHIDFNQMRKDMIAIQENLKGTILETGHEEQLIADLEQDIANAQPTANNSN